jgi:curli production assembly/transport component CsgE
MALALLACGAAAQEGELILKDSALAARSLRESYGGLVTNETVTIPGHDFFQMFVAAWRESDTADRYVLSVKERPSLTLGSEISITFGQRKLFQSALPASRIGITALAQQAVEVVYQGVVDSEIQKLLFRDPDLGPDEL